MSNATQKPVIIIRDIELISEMQEIESLQQAGWRFEVEDFYRAKQDDRSLGIYLLSYRKKIEDFI